MPGNRVAARSYGPPVRRPPSVHRPLERERIEERDGVLMAVDREMAVVGSIIAMLVPMNRERAITLTPARSAKVASVWRRVVELAQWLDPGCFLDGFPRRRLKLRTSR